MTIIERVVNWYAPLACLACATEGTILCEACRLRLPPAGSCCYLCNKSAWLGRTCAGCQSGAGLVSANAVTNYGGAAKDLVWKLKFGRVQAAAGVIAASMAERFAAHITKDVLLVPVPTARRRVRGRGYDQAQLIARALAKQTGCQWAQPLWRLGHQEQIGAGRDERRQQLQGAYSLRRPGVVAGRRVLLVDDVMTTGATVEAAAAVLYAGGSRVVGALVFARA